MDGKNSGGLND